MTPCNDELFAHSDLPTVAPWLNQDVCRKLVATGLFSPRVLQQETEADIPCLTMYDLVTLTCIQQLLRSGVTADQLRRDLYSPSSFRCDGFLEGDLPFLGAGALHGQKLPRFLEATNAEATVLVRLSLAGDADIEFIANALLGTKDYRGIALMGIECREIRNLIRSNIDSSITPALGQGDSCDHPRA
jgi:hypothetical protein